MSLNKIQLYTDGRAAGANPVSGSDFVTKDFLESQMPVNVWEKGIGNMGAVLSGSEGYSANNGVVIGKDSIALGSESFAMGTGSQALGNDSVAEGYMTTAIGFSEHAQGKYNATASGQIFSVGIGDAQNSRKNAISVITASNSASVYIYGIGGYVGNNPVPGTNDLATILSSIPTSSVQPDLSIFFSSASYNSTDKKIYFYNTGGVATGEVDATAFIKDGMVDTVTINTGSNQMIITFNTDAGKENITLNLTDIFNPSNFYTKDEINNITGSFLTVETDPVYLADSASLKASASLAKSAIQPIDTGSWASAGMWVAEHSASLIESASAAKTASSSAAAVSALTASLVASASIAKTASSSAAAISAKTGSYDALISLPAVTSADNGKMLQVVNGVWTLVTTITVYSGSAAPSNNIGNNGDIYLQS